MTIRAVISPCGAAMISRSRRAHAATHAHGGNRQVGMIAIAAQVPEHRPAQFRALGQQQPDDIRRRLVGKVAVAARDALFDGPRAVWCPR